MAHEIFISYRRKDASAHAEALRDRLVDWYGAGKVFLDTREILAGTRWPDEIRDALLGAKVVLVLIGPEWKKSLDERADRPDGEDWVREEVATALKRRDDGDLACLLPLLLDDASMPHTDAWANGPPSLVGCAGISSIQPLVHPAAMQWEHATPTFVQLQDEIGRLAQLTPCAARALDKQEAWICDEIAQCVAAYPELKTAWNSRPTAGHPQRDLRATVADLELAIKSSWPVLWPTVKDSWPNFQQRLRRILALLWALAIDPAASRVLELQGMQRRAVPAPGTGPAVTTAASLRRLPSYVSQRPVVDSFDTDYTLDADAVEPGVGPDLRAALHQAAWNLSLGIRPPDSDPNYRPGPDGALQGADLDLLRMRMESEHLVKQPHFLAFKHLDKDHDAAPALLDIAKETGMHAVAYHPDAAGIARSGVNLQALRIQISHLLRHIESLQ